MKKTLLVIFFLAQLTQIGFAQVAIRKLGGGVGTPYNTVFIVPEKIKVEDTQLGKKVTVNVYYKFFVGYVKTFNGQEAFEKVNTVSILCADQFKEKPIVTLETEYFSYQMRESLNIQKFNITDQNLVSSLRGLDPSEGKPSYIEKNLYQQVCN